ncbi:MAG: hypothetical protein ACXVJ7_10785 [Acidimicrobiia bacterium]
MQDERETFPARETPGHDVQLRLPVERMLRVMWIGIAALVVASFVAQFWRHSGGVNTAVNLLDSDQKLNFPSSAKILLMLASTGLLVLVGLRAPDRWSRVRWVGMGAIFALLTLDEMTYMHQRLSDSIHHWAGTHGALRFAWIVVYLPIVAVIAVVYLPFWRQLADRIRTRLLVAALLFAGGSAGIEVVKGVVYDDDHWRLSFGLVASLSDTLEFIGLGLLVALLLRELVAGSTVLRVHFDE